MNAITPVGAPRAMIAILRRALLTVMVVGSLFGLAATSPANAQGVSRTVDQDDILFLDLQAKGYRLGSGIRGYRTAQGVCVDFGDMIMALDLAVRLDKKSRRATGWAFDEWRTLELDRDAGAVRLGGSSKPLADTDIFDSPEGWCVDTNVLGNWLDVTLQPDEPNALLLLKTDRTLPFELAEARKAKAGRIKPRQQVDLSAYPQAKTPYRAFRVPSVDATLNAAVISRPGEPTEVRTRYDINASGELAMMSANVRLSSDNDGKPEIFRARLFRNDPEGQLFGPLKATSFEVGDVSGVSSSLVSAAMLGRGVKISNQPMLRSQSFDTQDFIGELPDGWDAELYRNGRLIDLSFGSGNGLYEFRDIELQYGANIFETVLYGPQGQIRREKQRILVGAQNLPPGSFRYWAYAQEAETSLVTLKRNRVPSAQTGLRGGVGVEYGLDRKTSGALALQSLIVDGRRENYFEAEVRRSIGSTANRLSMAVRQDGGYALSGQMLGKFGSVNIIAESQWSFGDFRSDRVDSRLRSENRISLDAPIKIGSQNIPFRLDAEHLQRRDGSSTFGARLRSSVDIGQIDLTGELEWLRTEQPSSGTASDRAYATLRASGRIGRVRLRGEVRQEIAPDLQMASVAVVADWSAGDRSRWRLDGQYDPQTSDGRLALGYTRQFSSFALTGQVEASTSGAFGAGLTVSFGFGPQKNGNLSIGSERYASSGRVDALVYRDLNRDGLRQASEPLVEGVDVLAGTARIATTDIGGNATVTGLAPYRALLVGVDASSLAMPNLRPAGPGIVITPREGIANFVELPLVESGEVDGTLVRGGGSFLAGVALELVDTKNTVIARTTSEFDGFFLFENVPYGSYRLMIEERSAAAISARRELSSQITLDEALPVASLGAVNVSGRTVTIANVESSSPSQQIAAATRPEPDAIRHASEGP